jgi:hypothetical protein
MTPGGIVMTWKSNEARAKRQKSSENVRQSFMFHYRFLGVFFVVASETLLLLFETSCNSALLSLPELKHPETPRVKTEIRV